MITEQPKAECPYCNNPIIPDDRYTVCRLCDVTFMCYNDGEGLHIKWERDIGHLSIALNLYPELNRTILSVYDVEHPCDPDTSLGGKLTEIVLDHCMTGVNKDNCVDKIKLLLVWR